MYIITTYSKNKAKKLGVTIKRSTNPKKKLDVFKKVLGEKNKKELKKIATIGDIKYSDYPTYIKSIGKTKAELRRKAYKKRHAKDRKVKGSNGYYADQILW